MTENLVQNEIQNEKAEMIEPASAENSESFSQKAVEKKDSENIGQSDNSDPKENLILGKFKSIDDLSKAYEEIQKLQGKTSDELGNLRKNLTDFNNLKEVSQNIMQLKESLIPCIKRDRELYDTPEYFQNETFKEIYTEALMAYGDNLDTDRMVSLLEAYVNDRIKNHDKENSAKKETQGILDSMIYEKNPKNSINPPKKSLSQMSEDEFRESIRKLI